MWRDLRTGTAVPCRGCVGGTDGPGSRCGRVIGAAADGTPGPAVNQIENQLAGWRNRRVQCGRRLQHFVADAGDILTFGHARMQGNRFLIADQNVAIRGDAAEADLYSFIGDVDKARDPSAGHFFGQERPGFMGAA